MRITIWGGDTRFRYAAEHMQEWGCDARRATWPEDCAGTDALLAVTQEEALPLPVDPEKTFCVVQRGGCERLRARGFRAAALEEDEEYLRANAVLTAEGALAAALGAQERALLGSRCLVIGYGRIGRALANMLTACGANVAAAVRPGPSSARASRDSMPKIPIADIEDALHRTRHVWNTVPACVLDRDRLALLPEDAVLTDLASAPYGFDLDAARAMGVRARRLTGLPGKYCPATAGAVVAEALLRLVRERG